MDSKVLVVLGMGGLMCLLFIVVGIIAWVNSNNDDGDGTTNTDSDGSGGDNTAGDNTAGDNTAGDNTAGDNTAGDNTAGDNTAGDNTAGSGDDPPNTNTDECFGIGSGRYIAGINTSGKVYYSSSCSNGNIGFTESPRSSDQSNLSFKGVSLDCDGGMSGSCFACAIDTGDKIYCKDYLSKDSWKTASGALKQLSVANSPTNNNIIIQGVSANDNIYWQSDIPAAMPKGEWTNIPGKLSQIDIDCTTNNPRALEHDIQTCTVCGVTSQNKIFCKDSVSLSDWNELMGVGWKHVSVSGDKLYGVDVAGNVQYKDNTDTGGTNPTLITSGQNFKQVDMSCTSDDASTCTICGVNNSNEIFCRGHPTLGEWKKMTTTGLAGNKLKYISVSTDTSAI